jgi:hypothetical protein
MSTIQEKRRKLSAMQMLYKAARENRRVYEVCRELIEEQRDAIDPALVAALKKVVDRGNALERCARDLQHGIVTEGRA